MLTFRYRTMTIFRTNKFISLQQQKENTHIWRKFIGFSLDWSCTPSLTAFRRKNALQAIHVRTPKLKPIDSVSQISQSNLFDSMTEFIFLRKKSSKIFFNNDRHTIVELNFTNLKRNNKKIIITDFNEILVSQLEENEAKRKYSKCLYKIIANKCTKFRIHLFDFRWRTINE